MAGHRGNSVGPTNHGARPINSWRRARVGGQRDPTTLSACKFSLYFRPSSKHVVRKETLIFPARFLRDLMPLSSVYFVQTERI